MNLKEKGITLIALVVTIVVLLILAATAIGMLTGESGVITKAEEAGFKTEMVSIEEEFKLYTTTKKLEDSNFELGTLNAGQNILTYNTKLETETGNIFSIVPRIREKYSKNFEVIKGELIYSSQNKRELKWALEIGMKINPYLIINGELISSDTNLMLMDENTGTIVIPEIVTSIGEGTFANVEGMKRIIIPATVKEIKKNAFYGNTTLEEVIILADGENGVEKIGESAFCKCINLRKVEMPDTVKDLGAFAFRESTSLENVRISNKIEQIRTNTFSVCTNLKEIVIPEGVKSIDSYTFQAISDLTITLPKSIEYIDGCFVDTVIKKIEIDGENPNFILENGNLLSRNRRQLYAVTKEALKGDTYSVPRDVISIRGAEVPYNQNIAKIILPESLEEIDPVFFPPSISEVEISNENPNFVSINKQILSKDRKILYICYSQDEIVNLEEGIETIKQKALGKMWSTQTLNLPDTLKILESQSINGIPNVKSIKLGRNVNCIDHAFDWNTGLESIEIDEQNPNFIAEDGAIYSKDKKKLLVLVSNVITDFEIPHGVEIIGENAFFVQRILENVKIPETVERIEGSAFSFCDSLTKLEIPKSVKEIEGQTFENSGNLREIIINNRAGSISGSPWGCVYGERAIKWLR